MKGYVALYLLDTVWQKKGTSQSDLNKKHKIAELTKCNNLRDNLREIDGYYLLGWQLKLLLYCV